MKVHPTEIPGCLLIEPRVFRDGRGELFEPWNARDWAAAGLVQGFVQALQSRSARGVVRGLHFQHPRPQAKLVWAIAGEILDVAVDLRRGSPTFGRHVRVRLQAEEPRLLLIPEGCAHGYATRTEAVVGYLLSAPHEPGCDRSLAWDDPALGIDWGVSAPLVSDRDRAAPRLCDFDPELLPR